VDTKHRQNGQAAVEFIVGMLVLVTIIAGGTQYLRSANAHRAITTTLRAEAGELALRPNLYSSIPHYLINWREGPDAIRHTDDDRPETGSSLTLNQIADYTVRNHADWETLSPLAHNNPLPQLQYSAMPMSELNLIKAERSDRVVVDRAVRELIFNRPHVTVRHTVWMPQLGGLY